MNNKFKLIDPIQLMKSGKATVAIKDKMIESIPDEFVSKFGIDPKDKSNFDCDALELMWESFEKGYNSMSDVSKIVIKDEYNNLRKSLKGKDLMSKFSDVMVFSNAVLLKDLVSLDNQATFKPNSKNKSKVGKSDSGKGSKVTHNEL